METTLARLESLFPVPCFQVAAEPIVAASGDLHPAERALAGRAVPARLAAFAAGRRAARCALRRLNAARELRATHEPAPILRDPQGCPSWPAQVVGSISHSPTTAVAVVARRSHARAIGVDIEALDRDVGIATLARVFVAAETAWLAAQPAARQLRLAYALFSTREALYKCVYQACAHRLAPDEVELSLDPARGSFRARWLGAATTLGLPVLAGRIDFTADHVISGVWCPPQRDPLDTDPMENHDELATI